MTHVEMLKLAFHAIILTVEVWLLQRIERLNWTVKQLAVDLHARPIEETPT